MAKSKASPARLKMLRSVHARVREKAWPPLVIEELTPNELKQLSATLSRGVATDPGPVRTQEEVARLLGINTSRVGQIEKQALRKFAIALRKRRRRLTRSEIRAGFTIEDVW
jgi:DNA-directed RNA polymerase sigma subunit (sigma70/sigma32)